VRKQLASPAVTVVIPTFNRADDLRRCLKSLVAQTFYNFEVLVCDDGSTDVNAEVAGEFVDRLDLDFETAENFGGPARPRNRGIARARAPYVAFLDSDDWWAPTKLERSVAALDAGADLVYHDLYTVRSSDQVRFEDNIASTSPQHPMFVALLCTGMSIPNSSVVVRADLLATLNGVSEDRELISVEDYDTWIRLSRLTERFVRIPECLGYYWVGGGNISAASPKQVPRIRALYARYLGELPEEPLQRAKGFLAYRIGRVAHEYGDHGLAAKNLYYAIRQPIETGYRINAALLLAKSSFFRLL
jgi:glycosyltransferase involved in cell wall biosynthesis